MEILIGKLALVGALGVACQWIAWRLRLPAIVLLLVVGFIVGPLTGVLQPAADFGILLEPLIAIAVAVILFEGGLSLNFAQVRNTSLAVRRLITWGAAMAFVLTTLAAHFVAGLSWQSAAVLGAILIVTGPTVIMPLLRHARLTSAPASLLRWEAILADPLGALLAMLVFEFLLVANQAASAGHLALSVAGALLWTAIGGYGLARAIASAFVHGRVPEYLKAPLLLTAVVGTYAISDLILGESGLLTVTVLGVTLANTRMASLAELRRFKEMMTVLLVSTVFIVLTASLQISDLRALDTRAFWFLLCLLFVIRPLSVLASTLGSGVALRERALVAWVAPRGVVAVAMAGLFGSGLEDQGIADGALIMPLTFAVVVVTVVIHGFSIRPLAAALGVGGSGAQGVLIVGASPWSAALAAALHELDVAVVIADRNGYRLRHARNAEIAVFYGEILSEVAEHQIDLNQYELLVAATDNYDYNALVCTNFGPEFGRSNVHEIGSGEAVQANQSRAITLGGRPLLASLGGFDELNARIAQGWKFHCTQLTEDFTVEQFDEAASPDRAIVAMLRKKKLVFAGSRALEYDEGDVVISFTPPEGAPENRVTERTA